MRSRRRGIGLLGLLARTLVAVVGGAAAMLVLVRVGVMPDTLVRSATAPAATVTVAASPTGQIIPPTPIATGLPPVTVSPVATAAVVSAGNPPTPTAAPLPTSGPGRPSAVAAAQRYLQAWALQRYPDMYRQLTANARRTIAEDRFVARYQAITLGAMINGLKTTLPSFVEPPSAAARVDARFTVTFQTARLGDFSEDNVIPLVFEDGDWKVDWKPDLIFRDLTSARSVRFLPDDPVRGAVLDRTGKPLAAQGKIVTLGAVPGRIKDMNLVVAELAKYLALPASAIRQKLSVAKPDWWVPFKDFPADRQEDLTRHFAKIDGVFAEEKSGRVYPAGMVAAHVVGYVAPVIAEDLKTLSAKGYEEGDLVGKAGVESWAEETLAGVRGGKLVIADADGETVRTVAERPAKNGGTIRLTIDVEVQRRAEQVLGDKVGSLVMIDPRDNSILALVSRPAYDPNGFIFGFTDQEWKKLADNPKRPFQPRANMSTYPTGSVFKVITMAAGLEKGGYQSGTQFQCDGQWGVKELNVKKPWGDWVKTGHGRLDLSQGLVESCDIVFYELGHKLERMDSNILADYSRQFGLGAPTGIQGLPEAEGVVPNPEWKKRTLKEEWWGGDAVNMAIGQGYTLSTPLQVANVYSTIANGGVLRAPLLIKSIAPGDGSAVKEFQAQERRRVTVSGQNLAIIREALKRVASTARGTANYAFNGYRIPIAAKTGSAENENPEAHAWFAGFGPADNPTLVVTVMIEGGLSGGEVAAPPARQAFEILLGK